MNAPDDLSYLSLTRWHRKPWPRVFSNAERLVAYRAMVQAEPINSVDWESLRKSRAQPQPKNVVAIRKRRSS